MPNAQLSSTRQFGFKVEATPGVAETLVPADFRGVLKDIQTRIAVGTYEREAARSTLTKLRPLRGSTMGTASGSIEWAGGDATTMCHAADLLLAMGFEANAVKRVTLAAGPQDVEQLQIGQLIGDNVDSSAATKTGRFVDYDSATRRLWYVPLTGTFTDTDGVFNYTATQFSGAVSGVVADAGFEYAPMTIGGATQHQTLTVEEVVGGYVNRIIGARGSGSIMLSHDKPPMLNFELEGPRSGEGDGSAEAKAFVINIPEEPAGTVAHSFPLTFAELGASATNPILTEITVELNNEIANRPSLGASVANSGYQVPVITGRGVTVTIDPETNFAEIDMQKLIKQGNTFAALAKIGDPTGPNGRFILSAPKIVMPEDLEDTERDGVQSFGITCSCVGNEDDELTIYHIF